MKPTEAAASGLPRRLRLGRRRRVVPDRGRRHRGRPRPQHLGHLLPPSRRDRQRRQRRRRLRPLPPLARRPRPDPLARHRVVPLLGGLVAGHARRPHGQPGRPRLLQAPGRRDARARHPAADDALPLGPARGARRRRRGRLALARPARPVRRLRDGARQGARRPGPGGDHAQRAVVLGVPRLRDGRARAGSSGAGARLPRRPPPQPRPRTSGDRAARRAAPERRPLGHPQPPPGRSRPPTARRTLRRPSTST